MQRGAPETAPAAKPRGTSQTGEHVLEQILQDKRAELAQLD